MAEMFGASFGEQLATRFADKLMDRLEVDGALPLPRKCYDVVVDDPDMVSPHVYRNVMSTTPRAAAIECYRRAIRDEGFRPGSQFTKGMGDEQTVELAREFGDMWTTVHRRGKHPQIDPRTHEYVSPAGAVAAE